MNNLIKFIGGDADPNVFSCSVHYFPCQLQKTTTTTTTTTNTLILLTQPLVFHLLVFGKERLQSWTKVLGTVLQYAYFPVISRLPLKTASFSKFSCSSPSPHPIQSWNSEKILDTRVQHCLRGEGRGWTCMNWKTPQKRKSVPRLLSMIVDVSVNWARSLLSMCCLFLGYKFEPKPNSYVLITAGNT